MRIKPVSRYTRLIQEISSEDVLKGFLGFGLFPEKIPNFLSSKSFFDWYIKKDRPDFERNGKDYIRYESMRDINIPRLMAIPNPFAYANLCKELSNNWTKIQKHFEVNTNIQNHKVSRIHIRKLKKSDCLFEMNYKNGDLDGYPEQDIIIGKRYCVEADISNCFPSIYSHSIPWALIGKQNAKNNIDENNKWVDKLDEKLRNIKHKETNGILIGPHTSNLISEIILVVIDNELWKKGYRYIRNIDDYKCYVSSFEEAEKFLLDLSLELKKFELTLNNKKTKISQLPKSSVSEWVNKLNNFHIGDTETKDKKVIFKLKKLKSFLDLATELMLQENTSAILNYAFKVIASKHLGEKALKYYTNQTHHLLLLYPYLARIMEESVFTPFNLSDKRIGRIANDLYQIGISKRFYEACSYSIYWALKFNLVLDKKLYKDALESNDSIFMTLTFLYAVEHKEKEEVKRFKERAKELKKTDFDRHWLFVYEILTKSQLTGDFKRIKNENLPKPKYTPRVNFKLEPISPN